ncbi:hypothetical protein BD410DRAFT_794966 [Rickenella mellea]|uniref:DUF5648 domain-containing protein n=1 Tax=Rickenella mellea TaxID=50990 RepID=A0A4Y7PMU1_9AGAM|nr:hypothetical protein BD410DRAFT_794963 [Rickenella mellea]TDL16763.1 hypothetical protein BD410DRAFT_794966 [Rickenella mellea]
MKFTISILAGLLWLGQTSALAVEARDSLEARQAGCTNPTLAVPFLRAFNAQVGDHFYTTDFGELVNAINNGGYASEGSAGSVFSAQTPSAFTVPFFRLFNPAVSDHFYTTSAAERNNAVANGGYISEGTAASVFATQVCGSVPLFRLFNPNINDHFYTTSAPERDNAVARGGYISEGTAAFVLPN